MEKAKVKIPAKINLTLDVSEAKNGFHLINSLAVSVDIYDEIIVKKRKDEKITLTEIGLKSKCSVADNNAYKSAKAYKETFGTTGVDIILNKSIPVGAGLGGSSADIAGVLLGMEKLFKKQANLVQIANSLGSDSGYMISGGTAVLSGRGDIIQKIDHKLDLNLLIIIEEQGVSTKECYRLFDLEEKSKPCTAVSVDALIRGDSFVFCSAIKNDLYAPAKKLLPIIKENIKDLNEADAMKALMTGSGSAVYGIFRNKKEQNRAYKKLLPKFGARLIKAKTI